MSIVVFVTSKYTINDARGSTIHLRTSGTNRSWRRLIVIIMQDGSGSPKHVVADRITKEPSSALTAEKGSEKNIPQVVYPQPPVSSRSL